MPILAIYTHNCNTRGFIGAIEYVEKVSVSLNSLAYVENGLNGVCIQGLDCLESDTFILLLSHIYGMPIESQNHYDIEDSLLGSYFESLREKEDNSRNLMNGWI